MVGRPPLFDPGEWTDDTSQAVVIAEVAATGVELRLTAALDAVGDGLLAWYRAGAPGAGATTKSVLAEARRGADLGQAARAHFEQTRLGGSNGALMRTAPVALAALGDDAALVESAMAVAALTHADPVAGEACVVWCVAIDRAINQDRLDGAWDALLLLSPEVRERWSRWLDEAAIHLAITFKPNGYAPRCLQAALAAILQTPGSGLMDSIVAAVRVGDDTDTVAVVAGALLGARWGATAIPGSWRRMLHDRWGRTADDLERGAHAIVGRLSPAALRLRRARSRARS